MNYQTETFDQVIDEIKPLLEANHREICASPGLLKLAPDYESYKALEDAGVLFVFTARKEGALVGYVVVINTPNLHHKDVKFSIADTIYIKPEYRGSINGLKLLEFTKGQLKLNGVDYLTVHMNTDNLFAGLLKHLKFRQIEEVWGAEL